MIGRLAAAGLRAWGATWRFSEHGPDPFAAADGPRIGACWHADLLVLAWAFRDRGMVGLASRSRDGDRVAEALRALGYAEPVRGSSTRGGAAALRALARRVGDGATVSVQVDGPRGPARVAKPGVLHLARVTGVPVLPVRFDARPAWRFASWDRTLLPGPGARVLLRWGEPISVSAAATDAELEALRRRLEAALGPEPAGRRG